MNNGESTSTLPKTVLITIKEETIIEQFYQLKDLLLREQQENKSVKKNVNKLPNNVAGSIVIKKLFEYYQDNDSKEKETSGDIIDVLKKQILRQKLKIGENLREPIYKLREFNEKIRKSG